MSTTNHQAKAAWSSRKTPLVPCADCRTLVHPYSGDGRCVACTLGAARSWCGGCGSSLHSNTERITACCDDCIERSLWLEPESA